MNLGNLQLNKQTKILIAVFLALIVYADASFIFKGQLSGLSRLDAKISKLNTDLANLNRGLENMRASQSAPQPQKKVLKSSKIISDSQVPGLLQEISAQANKLDIKIVQIFPSRQAQKEKAPIGQGKITPLLINLDLATDYHSLGRFIQALENSSVFMQVQELKIFAQEPDYLKQQVVLVLKTYVAK